MSNRNQYPNTHFAAAGNKVVRDYDDSVVGVILDQSRGNGDEVLVKFEWESEPVWCWPADLEPAD